jgi:rhodanese-related sulfurtransferase
MPDETIPQIDVDEAAARLAAGAALLDVREPDEWLAGHAGEAQHLPMGEIVDRLDDVPRDREVVVVCKSGGRSARVTEYLLGRGVTAVNLAGGMLAWQAAGLDIVTDDGAGGTVI